MIKLKLIPLSSIKELIEKEKLNRLQKTIEDIEGHIIACGGKADVFIHDDDDKDIIISSLEENGYKVKHDSRDLHTVRVPWLK